MAWEYQTVEVNQGDFFSNRSVDSELNELGKKGWRLVAAVFVPHSDHEQGTGAVAYTFEREIKERQKPVRVGAS